MKLGAKQIMVRQPKESKSLKRVRDRRARKREFEFEGMRTKTNFASIYNGLNGFARLYSSKSDRDHARSMAPH